MSEAVDTLNKGTNKEGVGDFIKKTREELDRTTFPSADLVRNTTIIVVISVIFFALYLFLVDQAWVYILEGLTWVVNKIAGY
ncbi:MAG TPA: preprotein translocase subunit SecE [Pyrinomonadaceae bacterium]|nr:preprotein translocase subunit SecE [Pyrinomonadaceae bacterium]